MANSVDPDQTAPLRSSLIWVYTVCSGLYVRIFRVNTEDTDNLQFKSTRLFILFQIHGKLTVIYHRFRKCEWVGRSEL